jgi:predicted CopG family antitoxin
MSTTRTVVAGRKNISISDETHAELNKLGVRGESFDDIIKKCIKAYKETKRFDRITRA